MSAIPPLKTLMLVLATTIALSACNKIYDGEQLSSKTINRLKSLKLLNSRERIYQFYSNAPSKAAGAGNFYSTERIAHYWLDDDKRKHEVGFAYYKDIAHIDTVYLTKTLTYISYMVITRKDGSQFRVYVGGKKPQVRTFFEHAVAHWKAATCSSK
jgi:hypothetical protein